MKTPIKHLPNDIIELHNLQENFCGDFICVEISKSVHGLPHDRKISNNCLVQHLAHFGCHPAKHTSGRFVHDTNSVTFTLVVDDFGVKHTDPADAQHLIDFCKITTDWTGTNFLGIDLDWDCEHGAVNFSMPGHIRKALARFMHGLPARPQHAPHPWIKPVCGAKEQLATPDNESNLLEQTELTRLQEIIGTLLCCPRATDNTLLVALGSITAAQSTATVSTAEKCSQLLDCCATHPDAMHRFHKSDMILTSESKASYLSETKSRSRVGGIHCLNNLPKHVPIRDEDPMPPIDGAAMT